MSAIFKTLAEFGITALTITGLIAYIGKMFFEHYLNLKIDSYKNDLETKTLEFKNELERMNFENQIKFSKLHNDRAQIIKELFADITELEKLINNVTTTWQGSEWLDSHEREDIALEYFDRTNSTFEKNKIFFSQKLTTQIENTFSVCKSFIDESRRIKNQGNLERKSREYYLKMEEKGETTLSKWLKLESKSEIELSELRESMAEKFRELYGIKE